MWEEEEEKVTVVEEVEKEGLACQLAGRSDGLRPRSRSECRASDCLGLRGTAYTPRSGGASR